MSQQWSCANGHTWSVEPTDLVATGGSSACPQCGLLGASSDVDGEGVTRSSHEAPPDGDVPTAPTPAPPQFSDDDAPVAAAGQTTGADVLIGKTMHTIVRQHGAGGLGVVSVARDEQLGRQVALKQIRSDRTRSNTMHHRFRREAMITGMLEHPGIVPIHNLAWDDAGRPFYTMKLVHGRTLEQAIKAYHDQPSHRALLDLLRRFVDVCQAIAYAHSRGVIHRDLKPSNVMLGDYGETVVLDWGLAKRMDATAESDVDAEVDADAAPDTGPIDSDAITREGHVIGTPSFMSPEQAAGRLEQVGPASDVYALGAVLYMLLTGRPPFTADTSAKIVAAVRAGHIERPTHYRRDVPRALEAICLKALRREPVERYAKAEDLAADVERWIADEPVSAYREPMMARAARWARRHRPAVAAVAALLVTGFVALIVSNVLIRAEQRRTETARLRAAAGETAALKANREATELLAQSYARTAELAAQRGQWNVALEQLDRALAAGCPDPIGVRLKKVEALRALNRPVEADKLLEQLVGEPDPGAHAGRLRFWQGYVAFHADRIDEAQKLFREALDLGLPLDDAAYVRGQLATITAEAISHYRDALAHNPFHHNAIVDLGFLLVLSGRHDEARQLLGAGAALFPEDRNITFLRALSDAFQGNRAAAMAHIDAMADQFGPKLTAAMRMGLEIFIEFSRFGQWWEGGAGLDLKRLMQIGSFFAKLQEALNNPQSPQAPDGPPPRLIRMPPPLNGRVNKVLPALIQFQFNPREGNSVQVLNEIVAVHPEGTLHFLRAMMYINVGKWAEAEQASRAAIATPAIVPNIAREARYLAAMVTAARYTQGDTQAIQRAALDVEERLRLGPIKPGHASNLMTVAMKANRYDLARTLTDVVLGNNPKHFNALRVRMTIALANDNDGDALRWADRALAVKPDDAGAKAGRTKAIKQLRKQLADAEAR